MEIQPGESIILLELIFETNQALVEIEKHGEILMRNPRDRAALLNLIRPLRSIQGNAILLHTPFLSELADLTLQIVQNPAAVSAGLSSHDSQQLFQGIEGMKFLLEVCNNSLTEALQGRKASNLAYSDEIEDYVATLKKAFEQRKDAALNMIQPEAAGKSAAADEAGAEQPPPEAQSSIATVSIELEQLEALRRRMQALAEQVAPELQAETRQLARALAELATIPLDKLLRRLEHFAAKHCRTTGKKVRFEIRGAAPRVTKRQFDTLSESLVHLIQNALDHGLETPAARAQSGKPEEGCVIVNVDAEGGAILLRISDDGRGIDRARLERDALQKTGRGADELRRLSLLELIGLPGVTSAQEVSEGSGRGMGMRIVLESLKSIGAELELQSAPGAGTQYLLRIPAHDA